jgi:VWFA-related protein
VKTHVVRQCLASLSIALLCIGATPARRLTVPAIGETIDVSIVNVDVVVTDAAGKRIRGLSQADFEILENGKVQPVSNFAEYIGANGVVAGPGVEPPPAQRRTIVLFLEQFYMPGERTTALVASLRDLVRKSVRPGDAFAIAMWDGEMKVVVDFTDDVELIEAALTDIGIAGTRARAEVNAKLREDVSEVKEFEHQVQQMAVAHAVEPSTVLDPTKAGDVTANLHAQRALTDLKRKIAGINAMISSIAGAEGKKMLLLGTHRLSEFAGAEYFYMGGTKTLDAFTRNRFDMKPFIRTIVDNANASGVTIYPLYPEGLYKPAKDPSARFHDHQMTELPLEQQSEQLTLLNETVMLTDVATKTGGLAAWGTTDIVNLIPSINDDVSDYYSLAYRATTNGEDRARNIVVKAKNPAYRIRNRHQFVEKSDVTRMKDRVVATLFQSLEKAPFTIGAAFERPRTLRSGQVYPLKVRIPIKELTLLPQRNQHAGAFSIFVVTAAELGNVGDVKQQTQSFEISQADLDRAQAGHFTYSFDVFAERETDRVAIGVLDEVSKSYALLRLPLPDRPQQLSGTQ